MATKPQLQHLICLDGIAMCGRLQKPLKSHIKVTKHSNGDVTCNTDDVPTWIWTRRCKDCEKIRALPPPACPEADLPWAKGPRARRKFKDDSSIPAILRRTT